MLWVVYYDICLESSSAIMGKISGTMWHIPGEKILDTAILLSNIISNTKSYFDDDVPEHIRHIKNLIIPVVEVDSNWNIIKQVFPDETKRLNELNKRLGYK